MEITEFRALFEATTRAEVNWDRLCADGAAVTVEALTNREALGDLLTVWVATADGGQGDPRCGGRGLTVRDAAVAVMDWVNKGPRVRHFQAQMLASVRGSEPLMLTLPVLAIGDRAAILDSTHRAVAAYRSALDVRVVLLKVHASLGSGVLPYMGHLVAVAAAL